MELLLVAVLVGVIPAAIAQAKGRSFVAWWIYGAALFIFALPHSLLIRPDAKSLERNELLSGTSRKCPFCAEIIKAEAVVCRFCGRDLPLDAGAEVPSNAAPAEKIIDQDELDRRFAAWQQRRK